MTVKISGNSSASTPSFAGDDGDSGLHATADQVQLVTNGTVGVTVDSSQQVGIATDNPGTRLDVISTASASTAISRFKSGTAAGDRGVEIASDANSNVFLQAIRGSDNTSNFQLCLNPNGGNVGIGTASPAKKLDVYEGSTSNIEQYLRNTTVNLLSKIDGTTAAQFGTETSHPLLFLTGNSERMRLLSSGGLTFNGDTAAANALDDYEEGTFTPTLRGSTTAGTATGTIRGRYIKIGHFVHASIRINNVNFSGSAGAIRIDGLPYAVASASNSEYSSAASHMIYNITFDTNYKHGWYVNPGSSSMYGIQSRSGLVWQDWASSNFHASSIYMNQTITYMAA